MDWLASQVDTLAKQASEITVYDIKSAYNKAKAYALNLTEYETKVHEATNDEPWGASSTLMQDIAQATFNFQLFNEVMPCIYARFTDKEARQWRQIYKALVLLEYLVKNGSERVVDDARGNLAVIRVLRSFHYIDENGKDQGINVRNRAKEIAELLNDLDRVRQERRKAKANRAKYTGVSSDGYRGGTGASSSAAGGGSRYGGFGSDSFYAGNGGGTSSNSGGHSMSGGFSDAQPTAGDFEEYDAGDDEDLDVRRSSSSRRPPHSSSHAASSAASRNGHGNSSLSAGRTARLAGAGGGPSRSNSGGAAPPPPLAPKQPEVNLFDFDDDDEGAAGPSTPVPSLPPKFPAGAATAAPAPVDDDFDDFQSATPPPPPAATAVPKPPQNVFSMLQPQQQPAVVPALSSSSSSSSFAQPLQASRPLQPTTMGIPAGATQVHTLPLVGGGGRPPAAPQVGTAAKPAADFSDLFDMFGNNSSSTSTTSSSSATTGLGGATSGGGQKQSLAAIAAQKRQDQLFASSSSSSASSSSKPAANNNSGGDGWDSLL